MIPCFSSTHLKACAVTVYAIFSMNTPPPIIYRCDIAIDDVSIDIYKQGIGLVRAEDSIDHG